MAFFRRIARAISALLQRFVSNRPNTPFEAVLFGAVREGAVVYSRRVIAA